MTTTTAAPAPVALVQARIGRLHLAVPAPWVAGVQASGEPLVHLPRRQGALAGLLPTAQGPVPVVDLARWVRMPELPASREASTPQGLPCYLTLQQERRRLAIQVDELLGLKRVPAEHLRRLHQHDDAEELFDAVLAGTAADEPPICVLEPQRLMRLLALWCEDGSDSAAADGASTRQHARRPTVALARVAGRRVAVDMRHVAQLMPMPALKTRLPPDGPSAGFADWRGGTLPVLNSGWLHAQPAPPSCPLVLVLQDDAGHAVALPVEALTGTVERPPHISPPTEQAPAWLAAHWSDDEGQVDLLDVPALLAALPESALARQRREPPATQARNEQPHVVLQAGGTVALPIDEVLAVLDAPTAAAGQTTFAWRGQQLSLRGAQGAPMVAVLAGADGELFARRIEGLVGLVPAGAAELSALPGRPGRRMLHVPGQAASYEVVGGAELVSG